MYVRFRQIQQFPVDGIQEVSGSIPLISTKPAKPWKH
jgi:hypothetical protein